MMTLANSDKPIYISLDKAEIKNLITTLRKFKRNLPKVAISMAKESAEEGKEYASELFDAYTPDHTIDKSTIKVNTKSTETGYDIIASGDEVLYAEFGTGDEGANNPHPVKSQFDLNPYNSGPYIKTDKNGHHYWVYQGEVSYGNPSGKQMWQTLLELRKHIVPEKTKEKVSDALSKL